LLHLVGINSFESVPLIFTVVPYILILSKFYYQMMHKVANSATDIHQQGPDNICNHTTGLTTLMYFNWLF